MSNSFAGMDRDRFRRATELFAEACALPLDARAAFVRERCADDPGLGEELTRLLANDACDTGASPLEHVRVELERQAAAEELEPPVPEWIGDYKVLGVLGVGGMGVVYRALQAHPEREVALKMIRPGALSASRLRRFEYEEALLARLKHPGIAQIYQAGQADTLAGRQPFFAMELVEGRSILEHAAQESLSPRARVELMARVCDAVHHAHQRGVIHRDLKPGNVLVDARGQPKILDFGVARATDADVRTTLQTQALQLVGTVAYMSPEQARGAVKELDVRSDVYSLGVILYELLAGRLPYDVVGKPIPEAVRVIDEEEPARLSSIDRAYRDDVETIVMTALAKERERRYPSAADLAGELRRWLDDLPIQARPPSSWYQLTKLARRNRRLFVAVTAAFAALLAGTITSSLLALREAHARDAAVASAARAEQITRFALDVFAPPEPRSGFRDVRDVLEHAAERVDVQLADHPEVAAELYYVIGNFYLTIELAEEAIPILERAAREQRRHVDLRPERLEASLQGLLAAHQLRRDFPATLPVITELIGLSERLRGADHQGTLDLRFQYARSLGMSGELERACELMREIVPRIHAYGFLGEYGSMLYRNGLYGEALAAMQEQLTLEPVDAVDHGIWNRFQLTGLLTDTGRIEEALSISEELLARARDAHPTPHNELAYSLYMRAHALHAAGEYDGSETLARESIAQFDSLHVPAAFQWRELGMALLGQGRLAEAEQAFHEYLERQRGTGDGEWYVAQAEAQLASAVRERGRLLEALELGRRASDRIRRAVRPGHPRIAEVLEPLALTLAELGEYGEADLVCREALEIRTSCMDQHAPPVASLRSLLAEIRLAQGGPGLAIPLAESAVTDLTAALGPEHPDVARALHVLAQCTESVYDLETQESLARSELALRQRVLDPGHPDIAESQVELARLLLARQRAPEAQRLLEDAVQRLESAVDACHPLLVSARDALDACRGSSR